MSSAATPANLVELVGEWLEPEQVAAALGVTRSRVGALIKSHHLASVRVPGRGELVPAAFVDDGEVVKGLPGLLTVLHDAGYDDRASIGWIFTDAELPGRPIDALRENRGSEAKRRAQALGF